MTWQGSGGETPPGGGAEDETRADWDVLGAGQSPTPDGAPPATPAEPSSSTVDQAPAAPAEPPAQPPGPPQQPPGPPQPWVQPPAPPPPGQVPAAPGVQQPGWGAPQPGYGGVPPWYGTQQPGYGAQAPGSGGVPGATVAWAPPSGYAPTGLEVPGVAGLRFAGVLHRFLAYWLDSIIVGIAAAVLAGIADAAAGGSRLSLLIGTVVTLGVEFLYFVGLWTSEARATLGMRMMKLQVGNAFDGRTLTMTQAVIRWAVLGLPFQALFLLPETIAIGWLATLWSLVLLISTAISPTRQGIHDRLANSAIVQPIGAQTPAVACLLLVLLLLAVPFIAILALILLGAQASTILSAIGESV